MKEKPEIKIASGITDAVTQIAMRAKRMFEEHQAADKFLNNDILPTTEAAYIFGVCSAATQLAVALMHADEARHNEVHPLLFKIDIEDAIEKFKEARASEEDEDEEYHQITIDDILDYINKRNKHNKRKPKKGE